MFGPFHEHQTNISGVPKESSYLIGVNATYLKGSGYMSFGENQVVTFLGYILYPNMNASSGANISCP